MADMRGDWADHPDYPRRWVHRDLGVWFDRTGNLQFGFINESTAEPLGDWSIEEIVARLPKAAPFAPGLSPRDRAETPLDLGLKGRGAPIYIIFRIVGPPNMSFQPNKKALSHKESTGTERYGMLRHVASGGRHLRVADTDCKIVYFACKPSNTEEFRDSFNLRVRLKQSRQIDRQNDRLLDIIIDPDVGYPGGSQVDP